MNKNCCGNCKYWNPNKTWCKKHDGIMNYGTLCTGWRDKKYVMECGTCEEVFCKSDEAFYIDDVRVCDEWCVFLLGFRISIFSNFRRKG